MPLLLLLLIPLVTAPIPSWPLEPARRRCDKAVDCLHECRACVKPTLNLAVDCPAFGFDCTSADENNENGAFIANSSCGQEDCVSLACGPNRTLFVGGQRQNELACFHREWRVSGGCGSYTQRTESAACLKSCGVDACRTEFARDKFTIFSSSSTVKGDPDQMWPANFSLPNSTNPCMMAWCEPGGLLFGKADDTRAYYVKEGRLTCAGDGLWRMAGTEEYYERFMGCLYCRDCNRTELAGGYREGHYFVGGDDGYGGKGLTRQNLVIPEDTCAYPACEKDYVLRFTTDYGDFATDEHIGYQIFCSRGRWMLKSSIIWDRPVPSPVQIYNTQCYKATYTGCKEPTVGPGITKIRTYDRTTFELKYFLHGCKTYTVDGHEFESAMIICAADFTYKWILTNTKEQHTWDADHEITCKIA